MDIEDRKLTKLVKIGKHDQKRENPQTLFFLTENNLSKELILNSTRILKDNEEYVKSVYLSAELHAEDSKKMHVSRNAKNHWGRNRPKVYPSSKPDARISSEQWMDHRG